MPPNFCILVPKFPEPYDDKSLHFEDSIFYVSEFPESNIPESTKSPWLIWSIPNNLKTILCQTPVFWGLFSLEP